MKNVVEINKAAFKITNNKAEMLSILPEGISLDNVLGFNASYFWSAYLLKPIAAFLAKIIHKTINRKSFRLNL
jgi:hypothetical protein